MLDYMRRANAKKWFLYILILPVVFSFVLAIFMVWGGAGDPGSSATGARVWVARVEGTEITAADLDRHRYQIENQYRQQLGDQFDAVAGQLNFDQIAFSQLLGQTLAWNEAVRMGLTPTDAEVAEAIRSAPVFQRNGRFIGRDAYINELRARNYNVTEFEQQMAREIAVDKVRGLVGTMVSVTPAEVEKSFLDEGQTAEVDYVLLRESDYPVTGEPSAREIEAWYRDHRGDYMTPEKRKASYVLIEREPLIKSAAVTDAEIQAEYEKDKDKLYTSPDQRRASHILIKVAEGATPEQTEAARARAAGLLAQARAGADFAKLARENSEDTSSAQEDGDLQWFGRGRMVPEFEGAVFSMNEGDISDLVKTQFGFHIIKLTGIRAAGVRPIDEVRDQIRQQIAFRKAQETMTGKSAELSAKLAQQASSFEGTAAELGYRIVETPLFARGEAVGELGLAPQASEEIFRLQPGAVSQALNTPQGVIFARLLEVKPPEPSPFEQVRDRVKADVTRSRSRERARAVAREIAAAGFAGFKEAADSKKVEVKSTGSFTRSSAPGDFDEAVRTAIFSRTGEGLVGPLDAPGGVALVKVIKRGPENPEEAARVKAALREQLLERKREDAFVAFLERVRTGAAIETNMEVLAARSQRASG